MFAYGGLVAEGAEGSPPVPETCVSDAFWSSALRPLCLINEAEGVALGLHGRIVLKEGR